ncbi:MAG: hypothetical protein Q4A54_09975, partial [Parabacteroides sp.]|nr:hypothetical protein [Parabacteroides sp.]
MKKLLSLVLICAMGFGMVSCVESEESPSVEAIRNAKAAQLTALANLYNAQAEAEKIYANAEAQLAAAQAAYQQALAAVENANAAHKAELTRQAKEKFAFEIQKIEAETEAAIAWAMKEVLLYEKEIVIANDELLQEVYSNYVAWVNELTKTQKKLLKKEATVAAAEAGIISAEALAEINILGYEQDIAENMAKIAVYEAYM